MSNSDESRTGHTLAATPVLILPGKNQQANDATRTFELVHRSYVLLEQLLCKTHLISASRGRHCLRVVSVEFTLGSL